MKDESSIILDDLLGDWHVWAQADKLIPGHSKSAMFQSVRASRQWDSENDVTDCSLHNAKMKAIDFHVGELCDVYRTAICNNARNIVTGVAVWSSARLPQDTIKRHQLILDARASLLMRLRDAGVV